MAGYSFHKVPQLGDDYEEFALDYCQTLYQRLNAKAVTNKLASVLRQLKREDEMSADDGEDLLELLMMEWGSIRSRVVMFHEIDDD